MSNKDEVEALCERLLTAKDDDHERGCQMRFALCSCGFDDARARTAGEAAAMLRALTDENERAAIVIDNANDAAFRYEMKITTLQDELQAAEARAIAAEEALKLWRSLVVEGGVPRYTVIPGAALNSVVTSTDAILRAALAQKEGE